MMMQWEHKIYIKVSESKVFFQLGSTKKRGPHHWNDQKKKRKKKKKKKKTKKVDSLRSSKRYNLTA